MKILGRSFSVPVWVTVSAAISMIFGVGTTAAHGQKNTSPQQVKVVNTTSEAVPVAIAPNSKIGVDSTPSNPVHVRNVESSSKQPFDRSCPVTALPSEPVGFANCFTVPQDKQLVLTHISAVVSVPTGQKVFLTFSHTDWVALQAGIHYLIASPHGTLGTNLDKFVASQQVQIYIPAGRAVEVKFDRSDSTGFGAADFNFSGYLIDVPVAVQ